MIIDGKKIAAEVLARAQTRAQMLQRRPNVLVYVSPDETLATRSYLKIKARSAGEAGCDFEETRSLTFSSKADAIIVQLPLAPEVNTMEVLNTISIQQDADVLSDAAREIFVREKIETKHKWAVVVGEGWLVGKPAAAWLKLQGANVEVVTSKTKDLSARAP